jgi:hypothetical protein
MKKLAFRVIALSFVLGLMAIATTAFASSPEDGGQYFPNHAPPSVYPM